MGDGSANLSYTGKLPPPIFTTRAVRYDSFRSDTQPNSQEKNMNSDQVKGAIKEAAGTVQRKAGEVTGSTEQQLKGSVREAEGNVQKNYGDVKEAVKDANKR
jgi:uncharacterized protein YjbJ (UPF0337 family)